MLDANSFPPITAIPVQIAWPEKTRLRRLRRFEFHGSRTTRSLTKSAPRSSRWRRPNTDARTERDSERILGGCESDRRDLTSISPLRQERQNERLHHYLLSRETLGSRRLSRNIPASCRRVRGLNVSQVLPTFLDGASPTLISSTEPQN